jgi:hypothetical protein
MIAKTLPASVASIPTAPSAASARAHRDRVAPFARGVRGQVCPQAAGISLPSGVPAGDPRSTRDQRAAMTQARASGLPGYGVTRVLAQVGAQGGLDVFTQRVALADAAGIAMPTTGAPAITVPTTSVPTTPVPTTSVRNEKHHPGPPVWRPPV